ncbi:MAG: phenylacetate--CoA ligase [Spirochaetales bacterium]|nr:phenylacetate--CoA ligase [Spirochaetales bacterium]
MATGEYWDRTSELLSRSDLEALQFTLLQNTLAQARKSDYYAGKLAGIEIRSLADIRTLPFCSKQDLRDHFPYGFLTVSLEETVRLHSSSGTTGNPTVVFHTQNDLDRWQDIMARSLYMAGARKSDVFQNMMGYGLFTGGLGLHYGAEKLGMLVIPAGPGNTKRQIWFMQQFGTTAVHILPSYALRLGSILKDMNIDPRRDLGLRMAFIGAEPHSEEIRQKVEELLGIKAYNSYGLSEMCGPGVGFECTCQNGLHIWEDHFYPEIIDPENGKVLPDGETGELVLTSLRREAMPLIRYRTRDLTRIIPGTCACGRTHRRIERIKGRSDDMLIINGVNIFPVQIERVLMRIPGIGSNYLIEIHKENYLDKLHIRVELDEGKFNEVFSELEALKQRVESELQAEITVHPHVILAEPRSLPTSEGKAVRVADFRKQD